MSLEAEPTMTTTGGPDAGDSSVILAVQPFPFPTGVSVYFYELHEGDDEIFSDVLLVRETEMEPDDFFELVQSIRRRVQDTHEHDTLIEAIAAELERDEEFVLVGDDRLTAAVNVSPIDAENILITADHDDDEEADGDRAADYRAIIAEFDPHGEADPRTN
jgi:hypothetical protein